MLLEKKRSGRVNMLDKIDGLKPPMDHPNQQDAHPLGRVSQGPPIRVGIDVTGGVEKGLRGKQRWRAVIRPRKVGGFFGRNRLPCCRQL